MLSAVPSDLTELACAVRGITYIKSSGLVLDTRGNVAGYNVGSDSVFSVQAVVRQVLKQYSTGAHMYLPGVGSNINGFNPGNYVESTGATPATVDGPVGLVLDAAGSVVQTELASNASGGISGEYFELATVSVREITGIHASQATAGYKPAIRKGIVNLLLNSSAPATQTVSLAVGTYTLSLIGTGSVVITGLGAGTLTGTGASDLVTLTFSVAVAGAVIFTKAGSVTSFGLFQGTLTAAQILAYGGIPLTTTAAASSVNGPYYLAFDGVDDRLDVGAAFQPADDFCMVAVFNATKAKYAGVYSCGTSLTASAIVGITNSGHPQFYLNAGGASSFQLVETTDVVGSIAIVTCVRRGSVAQLRLNGVVKKTGDASAIGSNAFSGGWIGNFAGPSYLEGKAYDVIPIKGTLSDADITILEQQAAASAGGRLVAGAFVSNY